MATVPSKPFKMITVITRYYFHCAFFLHTVAVFLLLRWENNKQTKNVQLGSCLESLKFAQQKLISFS